MCVGTWFCPFVVLVLVLMQIMEVEIYIRICQQDALAYLLLPTVNLEAIQEELCK